jgi:alpha-tubulin suppressor-like RCC1 family protein
MVSRLRRVVGVLALCIPGSLLSVPSHALVELTGIRQIVAGNRHSCALTTAGGVKCWGTNFYGQLGDNSTVDRPTPVDVSGLANGVSAIAVSGRQFNNHSCALTMAGGVKCWGLNIWGQLGDASTDMRVTPVDVSGLRGGVVAITAGMSHTCALTIAGGVKCWGFNFYGQLGDSTTTGRLAPVDVSGLAVGVAAITAGAFHTCAVTTSRGAKCWGDNGYGQIGDNSTPNRPTSVDVSGLASGVADIAAGRLHTCALTTGGGVKCWGANFYGQLGDNSTMESLTPVDVSGLPSGITAIAAGRSHACALTSAGGVKCWGSILSTPILTPIDVSGLGIAVAAITAGGDHTCALATAGGVKCWGSNTQGQLGDNSTLSRFTPADVWGHRDGVAAIRAGGDHTCALTTVGGVKCWGLNILGELGDGTAGHRYIPAAVLTADAVLVEYYNSGLDHFFIIVNASEAATIDSGSAGPGWSRTGNTFKSGGNTSVCRFYGSLSPGPNSHFFTADSGECTLLKQLQTSTPATQKRWNYEGIDFLTTVPVNGTCPNETSPIYRAYNNGFARNIDSNHRITGNSAAMQEVTTRGWIDEGVVMCAPL